MNSELEKLLEKVSLLYLKFGIKSVTMDDVAHELGISKKTLYQYVHDKTELVEKVVEHVRQCTFSVMKGIGDTGGNAIEQLIDVSLQINAMMKDYSPSYEYDLRKYYPDIYNNLMSARRKLMYESIIANIRQGKKEGIYRRDLDEIIIAKLLLFRMESLRSSELFTIEEIQSVKFFGELFVYHIRGIATDRGLEVLDKNLGRLARMKKH